MEQENKIRKAIHELQEKYKVNRERTNKIETDACVKFNNAELYISGIGYVFKFSIGYSNPFKEIVISEYEFTHELYNENCKLLFAKLYTDLMEFIDIWN